MMPATRNTTAVAALHPDPRHRGTVPPGTHAAAGATAAPPRTVIRPRRGWVPIDWRELWQYRELLYFLIWRDVKVRYKQTVLGAAWAIIQPLFAMGVFTIIFGHFAGLPSEGQPYALFVYAGLLPWTFFANSVTQGGQSLVNQQHLLTKIYLPRLFVPAATIGGGLVDFAIAFAVGLLLLAGYMHLPGWPVVFLPLLIGLMIVAALGVTLGLAALTVAYRDFRYVVPFLIQALMYISPVIYTPEILPPQYRWLLGLNPMAGVIDGFRVALLGGRGWDFPLLATSIGATLACFAAGLYYFRTTERRFADIA